MFIKKKDKVYVLAGKDKGKTGDVLKCFFDTNRVIVSKINLVKRHTKPTKTDPGGIHEKEASIDISNVQLVCAKCGKRTRVKYETIAAGEKVRVCKKCGEIII
jgi:large subunit ribosomal protein L24